MKTEKKRVVSHFSSLFRDGTVVDEAYVDLRVDAEVE